MHNRFMNLRIERMKKFEFLMLTYHSDWLFFVNVVHF